MNDEDIMKQLDRLEVKLDSINEIINKNIIKTELQQKDIDNLRKDFDAYKERNNSAAWKIITPIISAIIAAVMSLILR